MKPASSKSDNSSDRGNGPRENAEPKGDGSPYLDAPPQIKRHAREMVLKMLYEIELAGLDAAEARATLTRRLRRPDELAFALALLEQTLENLEKLDKIIGSVAENWDLARMAVIDRNILRLGAAEILSGKVPTGVAINEAIEVAKKFSTEDSGRFVNGILDKVARLQVKS